MVKPLRTPADVQREACPCELRALEEAARNGWVYDPVAVQHDEPCLMATFTKAISEVGPSAKDAAEGLAAVSRALNRAGASWRNLPGVQDAIAGRALQSIVVDDITQEEVDAVAREQVHVKLREHGFTVAYINGKPIIGVDYAMSWPPRDPLPRWALLRRLRRWWLARKFLSYLNKKP